MIPTDLSVLANHLWQSTLFALAACLLALALKENRAAVRYWIWLSASVKFLIPFSVLFSISSHLKWSPPPAILQPEFTNMVNQISRPFVPSADVPMQSAAPAWASQLPVILVGLWLAGFVLGLVVLSRSLQQIRAVRRSAPGWIFICQSL